MDKKEIVVLALSSAVIGAAFTAILTAFNSWRERVARERELVMNAALDLTKAYMSRVAMKEPSLMPEALVLSKMHAVMRSIFKDGEVSQEDLDWFGKRLREHGVLKEKSDD